ncbi:MAG: MFS transporter [Candidatus Thermoplasmatota archaeon]|nr:MFS transporter [Candidatus Thermoplasmatota archaeon]
MNKWFLMLGYGTIVAASQMLWLTFAPITTIAATEMNTSISNIGILSLVFPLVYIILAIPLSRWLDRSFIPAIITGVLLTGVGGVLRLAAPFSFPLQLSCQIIISIGQPLLLGSLAIVPVYYFNESERPLAISLGSLSLFIGIIIATAGGALIYYRAGYTSMLLMEAIPGILGMILVGTALAGTKIPTFVRRKGPKFRFTPLHYKLAIMLFVGMGVYDALDTWLQPMISGYGISNQAGNILALMTFMGILGAGILPQIVSRKNMRKTAILAIAAVSIIALAVVSLEKNLFLITYTIKINGVGDHYVLENGSGSISVNGSDYALEVDEIPLHEVTFDITGSVRFPVTIVVNGIEYNATGTLSLYLRDGTYSYRIITVPGLKTVNGSGTFTVNNASVILTIAIEKSSPPQNYNSFYLVTGSVLVLLAVVAGWEAERRRTKKK